MDKIDIHQLWIFPTTPTVSCSRSGSESWSGAPVQYNLILGRLQKIEVVFLNLEASCGKHIFFRKKLPENESNWWEVWLARAGLGAVALSSTAAPVLAPLSLKATPGRLISGPHTPPSPCLGGKRRPAPNASPATDAAAAPGLIQYPSPASRPA